MVHIKEKRNNRCKLEDLNVGDTFIYEPEEDFKILGMVCINAFNCICYLNLEEGTSFFDEKILSKKDMVTPVDITLTYFSK